MSPLLSTFAGAGVRGYGFLTSGLGPDAMTLISTQVLAASGNVTFSSIPQTYTHLHLRVSARDAGGASSGVTMSMRFNGVTTASYTWANMNNSTGSITTGATSMNMSYVSGGGNAANVFASALIEVLDYTNSSKLPHARSMFGVMPGSVYSGTSQGFLTTGSAAVTQIDLFTSGTFAIGSRFSLYGVKA